MNFKNHEQHNHSNIPNFKQPTPYKKPLKTNANIIGFGLLLFIFFPYVIQFVGQLTQPFWFNLYAQNIEIGDQIISMVQYTLSFVVSIAVMSIMLNIPTKIALPLRAPNAGITLGALGVSRGALFFGSMLTGLVFNTIVSISGYAPTSPDFTAPRGLTANILHFISMAVLPALLEEAMFRGIIMQSLRRFGDGFALIISSILFGVIHGNFVQAPYTILIGLIMGYFTLYTGSLWPAIIIHFFNNGLSVVQDWVSAATTVQQDNLIAMVLLVVRLLIGAISLILLKRKMGSVFYVPPSKYPLEEKEKYISFISAASVIILVAVSIYFFVSNLEPYEILQDPAEMLRAIRCRIY